MQNYNKFQYFVYFSSIFSNYRKKNYRKNIIHYSDELFNYGLCGFDGNPCNP